MQSNEENKERKPKLIIIGGQGKGYTASTVTLTCKNKDCGKQYVCKNIAGYRKTMPPLDVLNKWGICTHCGHNNRVYIYQEPDLNDFPAIKPIDNKNLLRWHKTMSESKIILDNSAEYFEYHSPFASFPKPKWWEFWKIIKFFKK